MASELNKLSRVAARSGKVRKPGKTKKNDKSQVKMGVFEKSQKNCFKKNQILSAKIYKILHI